MILSVLFFGILSGCLLSVLVGIIGSGRRIGFGWAFLASIFLSPVIGLILVLLSDRLPENERRRWGCLGGVVALSGFVCLAIFLFMLVMGIAHSS